MKHAVRRRAAVGALIASAGLVGSVLIAPAALARTNGLSISPAGAVNSESAKSVTFNATDTDFNYGGKADFQRLEAGNTEGAPFQVTIPMNQPPQTTADRSATVTVNFTDVGDGLGSDGPADAGVYRVKTTGTANPAGVPTPGGGEDDCVCFTVLSAGPVAVTSMSPSALRPGTAAGPNRKNVSIFGNNFERGSVVKFLKADGSVDTTIDANQPPTVNDNGTGGTVEKGITTRTELKRRISVGANSEAGSRDVLVENLDGNKAVCEDCFFVAGPPLVDVSPDAAFNDPDDEPVTLTFTGTQVTDGQPRLDFLGNPGSASRQQLRIVGTNVTRNAEGTAITATFDLRNAAPGDYQPIVENPDSGVINACDTCRFTVSQVGRAPVLNNLDGDAADGIQKEQRPGTTATYAVNGSNFSKGATLLFTRGGTTVSGITATAVEFVSPSRLNATISVPAGTSLGPVDVTVQLTDEQKSNTCSGCLVVSNSAPPTGIDPPKPNNRFVALPTPERVLDSREGLGTEPGKKRGEVELDLSEVIPGQASAAVLNVTVTGAEGTGYVVVYPDGTTRPRASNLNFVKGVTQANEVVTALRSDKKTALFLTSTAHVVADLAGWFTTADDPSATRFVSQTPSRVLNSRTGRGTTIGRKTGEVVLDLSDKVAAGTTAVALNLTVTRPLDRGYVVAYPTGTPRPETSNVNYAAGRTQANEAIVKLGAGNKVSLFVAGGATFVIADLLGQFTTATNVAGQLFTPLTTPERVLDSRPSTLEGTSAGQKTGEITFVLPDDAVPAGAKSVVLNLTTTQATKSGYAAAYSGDLANWPGHSNVNFRPSINQANEVITAIGSNREVKIFVGGPDDPATHLIADVGGYFTAAAG